MAGKGNGVRRMAMQRKGVRGVQRGKEEGRQGVGRGEEEEEEEAVWMRVREDRRKWVTGRTKRKIGWERGRMIKKG